MNRKIILFSTILLSFSVLFFSCGLKINVDEELSLVTRPDVKEHDKIGFTLSTKLYTDNTQYINVFRRTVTNPTAAKPTYGDVVIIGTLFPQNINSANKTYSFDDVAVINETSYQYRMSYYDSKTKEFTYSAWSEAISLPADSEKGQNVSEVSMTYDFQKNTFLVYNDESKSLFLMKSDAISQDDDNTNTEEPENTNDNNNTEEPDNSGENENSQGTENANNGENSDSENPLNQNENEIPETSSTTTDNNDSENNSSDENSSGNSDSENTNSTNNLITKTPATLYGIEPVPALIFKKSESTEVIAVKLSETDKTFENEIHLISYLPDSWWKTQLIFCGVVGYQEKRIDDKLQYIHWTEPNTTLKIKKPVTSETGTTYADEPTFSVDTSASGTSFDFTLPN